MALKYYPSYLPVTTSPDQEYKDDLQAIINEDFENSPSLYEVEEELVFGTLLFTNTNVRINHIIQSSIGKNLGDDFKSLIFKDMAHPKGLGYRYRFDNNIWITINSDNYKYVTASTVVRRCNNVLRWLDSANTLIEEPCAIDNSIQANSVDFNFNIDIASGDIFITAQNNAQTQQIRINDRFLFGGQAFKIRAINNFLNNQTYNNLSNPLIYFHLFKVELEEDDDIINNIANTKKNDGSIVIVPPTTGVTDIIISPQTIEIPEGQSQTYLVYKYIFGVQQPDVFTFTTSGVPSKYFNFTVIDGNTFMVENLKMYKNAKLKITCSNGIESKEISIRLKGLW